MVNPPGILEREVNLILAIEIPAQYISDEMEQIAMSDPAINAVLGVSEYVDRIKVVENVVRLCYQRGMMLDKVVDAAAHHLETNVALSKCKSASIYGKAVVNHRRALEDGE